MTRFLRFLFDSWFFSMSGRRKKKGFSTVCNPNMKESSLKEETENLCQHAEKAAACLENEGTRNGNTVSLLKKKKKKPGL